MSGPRELSDDEVFGPASSAPGMAAGGPSYAPSRGQSVELSDADVFGPAGAGPGDGQRWVQSPTDPNSQALEVDLGGGKPAPPPKFTMGRGLGLGLRSAMSVAGGLIDIPSDMARATNNLLDVPFNAAAKALGGKPVPRQPYHQASEAAQRLADSFGLPRAETAPERYGDAATQGVMGALTFTGLGGAMAGAGGGAGAIGEALAAAPVKSALSGGVAGMAQQGAADAGFGPIGQFAAGLAGGVGGYGGLAAVENLPRLAASASRAPALAPVLNSAAEANAARTLQRRAADPSALRESLAQGPSELVPGSAPTTFQQTGDMGIGALEREVAARRPELFNQRRADQNTARRSALSSIQSGADPNDVAKTLRAHFDEMDAQTQAEIQAAQDRAQGSTAAAEASSGQRVTDALSAAQGKAEGLGGAGTPEGYGSRLRSAIDEAHAAQKARDDKLWQAIGTDKTGNVQQTIQAAHDIPREMPATARPMEGEEGAVFASAQKLNPLSPLSEIIALRSRVSDAMAQEMRTNGASQAHRRLSQLRSAIQDNLSTTIAHEVARDDAAVARGMLHPDEALAARLRGVVGGSDGEAQALAGPQPAGRGYGQGYGGGAASGSPGASGPGGAGLSPSRGPRGGAGGSRLPSAVEIENAKADLSAWRQPTAGSLFAEVKRLGGLKVRDASGFQVPGPDVSSALTDVRYPGLVSQNGMSPERVAQALADAGWFGPQVADPSAAFEAALAQEARGSKVFHPDAAQYGQAQRLRQIGEEANASGASAVNSPTLAAQRLARYRMGQREFRDVADQSGIPGAQDMQPHELLGDLEERAAIRSEGSPDYAPATDEAGAEFDRLARSGDQPTMSAQDKAKLDEATAAHRARKERFGADPVRSILKTSGFKNDFVMPDGQVPGRIFHSGPASYAHVQAAVSASPDALPVLQDYAAMSLKRAAMTTDGVIDPAKFARWQAAHADALRALPAETQARFADAAAAGQAVGDAGVARAAAIKAAEKRAAEDVAAAVADRKARMGAAEKGPTGRVMGLTEPDDISRTVGSILNGRTATADMKALGAAAARDPNAAAGLRQAIADHIASKFIGNTEAGTSGVSQIKADAFQTFIRERRPALLAGGIKPDEIAAMELIAEDLKRANRSITAVRLPGGSNTAQDSFGAMRGQPSRGARAFIDAIAGGLGFFHSGPIGALVTGLGADAVQGLRAAGIARTEDLVARALLDPEVARVLLQKAPADATPTALRMRSASLLRALGVVGSLPAPVKRSDRSAAPGPSAEPSPAPRGALSFGAQKP